MSDFGLTHIALPVRDVDRSIAFYVQYAGMQVVHRRIERTTQSDVVWLSDLTRPFVIVLIQVPLVKQALLPLAHLGVACTTHADVDRLCQIAQSEGVLLEGPADGGSTIGYWAFLQDPDGHTLEVSYGQEIAFTVQQSSLAESSLAEPSLAEPSLAKLPADLQYESLEVSIRQAAEAWMAGDADAFADLFTPDGEFMVPGHHWVGYSAIRQAAIDFAEAYRGVEIDIHRIAIAGQQAVVEWHWQETEIATGKHREADDAIVVDFSDGKIRRWREYIDTQSVK